MNDAAANEWADIAAANSELLTRTLEKLATSEAEREWDAGLGPSLRSRAGSAGGA